MGAGAIFDGLISGLNEGIGTLRQQNQREAEIEMKTEQEILMTLAQTSPNPQVRNDAVEALLNLGQSGKPTGFVQNLLKQRGKNPDIARLITSAQQAGLDPLTGQPDRKAPVDTSQPPAAVPPVVPETSAPIAFGQGQELPMGGGEMPPQVAPLPSAPQGPAALPINTTQHRTPISFSAGVQAASPVSTSPAAFPPPPSAAMPPAPVTSRYLDGPEEIAARAERLRSIQRQPTSASGMAFSIIEDFSPLEAAGTITPEQKVQLDAARKIFEKRPESAANTGSFEDLLQRYAREQGRDVNSLTTKEILEQRKIYNQIDDKAPASRDPVLNQIRELQLLNLQKGQKEMSPATYRMATSLADDYNRDSKDYMTRLQAYQGIESSAKDPSAAGDLSIIFNFMRMQDPTSTVREGEQAMAENARGVPEYIRALYNKILTGQRLTPEQRKDFVKTAKTQFQAAQKRQRGLLEVYKGRASRIPGGGVNPDDVVIDYDKVFGLEVPATEGSSKPVSSSPPSAVDAEVDAALKKLGIKVKKLGTKVKD